MNRTALRYQLDGRGIYYEEKRDGFVVFADSLSPALLSEIAACGGEVAVGHGSMDQHPFLVSDGGAE